MKIKLFLFILILSFSVYGSEVKKVKGKYVVISMDKVTIKVGTLLKVINPSSRPVAIIRITKIGKKFALGKIRKGKAKLGYSVENIKVRRKIKSQDDFNEVSKDDKRVHRKRERQEDHSQGKNFNVRTNLLYDALGYYNLGVDVAISNRLTLGVEGTIFNDEDDDLQLSSKEYGVSANWYINTPSISDGWVLGLYLGLIDFEITDTMYASGTSTLADFTFDGGGAVAQAAVYYHWVWSLFNLSLGGGVRYYAVDSTLTLSSGESVNVPIDGAALHIELSVGLAF
jgi:hypothetical protein